MKLKKYGITVGALALTCCATVALGVGLTTSAAGGTVTQPPRVQQATADVSDKAYYVGKEESTAAYGEDLNTLLSGVKASLALDDAFTFNNVIDLEEIAEKDEPFIQFLPVVEEKGTAEYTQIFVELIDVYDPSNYVRVKINAAPQMEDSSDISYFLACASNGQKLTGLETNSNKLHINNEYGQWSVFSFSSVIGAESSTGLYYDVDENAMYAYSYRGVKKFIIDFDDSAYFGTYVWDGFTSNEVYCRISCAGYKKDKANILVTKYGDYDLTDPELCDEVAPALSVDYGEYTKDTVSDALINKPYNVFPATSFDAVDGAIKTDVKVYLNYYSAQKMEVKIKSGAFTPKIAAPHHIVYTATDAHGNSTQEVVEVNVLSSCEPLDISFVSVPETAVEGDKYLIPEYTLTGGLGKIKLNVGAVLNGKELEIKDGGVRPYSTGTLKMTYTLEDYIGQTYTVEHTITVTEAVKPTFIDEPLLPKYFISGNSYTLPQINAYDYVTAEGAPIAVEISVVENGVEKQLPDGVYVPGEVSEAEIVYTAKIGNETNSYRKTVPVHSVKDEDGLDMAKYFLSKNGGTTVATPDAVEITANGDDSFEYLNYVTALSFRSEFTLTETALNAKKFHIYLTDILDPTKIVKFSYVFEGGASEFYVNDDEDGAVAVGGATSAGKRYEVNFAATENKVYYDINNSKVLLVYTYLDGTPFNGFTNSRAYVAYELEEVEGSATIEINSLNGNYFNDESADYLAPLIDLNGDIGGEYSIGEVMTLPEIIANDVLSGDLDAYVTVTVPSGEVAKSTDGKLLQNVLYDGSEISLSLTEYGSYLIVIYAQDPSGNSTYSNAVCWVVDKEIPTLNISGSIVAEAKVGDKIKIPKATASDNYTEEVTVKVYVISVGGYVIELGKDDAGFVATKAGVYTVVYTVSDEEGNFNSQYYKITVTEVQK